MEDSFLNNKTSLGSQAEEPVKLAVKEAEVAETFGRKPKIQRTPPNGSHDKHNAPQKSLDGKAGESNSREREKVEEVVFKRNPRIARTPPMRDRSHSLQDRVKQGAGIQPLVVEVKDLTTGESDEEYAGRQPAKKRKNSDASPNKALINIRAQEGKQSRSGTALNELHRTIGNVQDIAKKLTQLVKENPNTQKGIKRAVEKLELAMEFIAKERELLSSLRVANLSQMRKKSMDSTTQTEETLTVAETKTSVATQSNPRKAGMIQSLTNIKTFSEWEEVADKQWEKDLLGPVTINERGNLLNTDREAVKLCWIHRKETWQNSRQKAIKDKYPELMDADGDFEVLELTSKLRVGGEIFAQKIIKATHEGVEKGIYEMLIKTKDEMEGRRRLAMNEIQGITIQRLQKLVAWVFFNSEVQEEIYPAQEGRKNLQFTVPSNQVRARNSYALVVEQKGKQYKDVLEKVKPTLKDTSLAKCIKGLRSLREGNKMVITVEKDEESLNKIGTLIGNIHQDIEVRALGDVKKVMKPILIMDALTSKEEVISAVESKTGLLIGSRFRLSEMRPNMNNTRAITMWVDSDIADKLTVDGALRVGIVNCRVEEKIKISKCKRCWEYGHKAKDCVGQDLTITINVGKKGMKPKYVTGKMNAPYVGVRDTGPTLGNARYSYGL